MKTDRIEPEGKWTFDSEVTQAFSDMLERSIPQYEVMRKACFDIACRFVKPGMDIVDIGCSRGEAIAPLIDKFGAQNRFIGLEISEPMLEVCRERFKGYINCGVVDIRRHDLRRGFVPARASVVLSVLSLQFVPIEYRQKLVRGIYDSLLCGGAFIVVEKVLGESADLDQLMVDLYYGLKREHGYSQESIDRKRLSLEGVLVPVTAKWNEELLRRAGFEQIDCFWRWMDFAGWVAVK